uniref:Reverse transcriptase RNase H-like domain-containing protein n=1 Tax=Nicotiana tabacum TaxID=4097 RepID=A0A1S4BRQ3_TOBAC|nr:PREDICTED: uncharacterized protein LOC107811183 [Nicotiana tabacum]
MVEWFVEDFMDDFSLFGPSFYECLTNLSKVLAMCEETNLVLNREKWHFMVGEGFYRRLIKDFSKVSSPLFRLLEKDVSFKFDGACLKAFEVLNKKLVSEPIIVAPDWNEPFELMCDELLVVVWAFDKFWAYLVGIKVIVYTNHAAIRLETRNHVAEGEVIKDTFPDEQLLAVTAGEVPWLRLFSRKLKSRWLGPFEIVGVTPHGAIELHILDGERTFLVNGQRVKHYYGDDFDC